MPWAFLAVVALCLGVECALRQVAFERVTPYAWGMGEYDASALRLRTEGPPEVLVLGTSRAREALDLPALQALLTELQGASPALGNHALSGGRAEEVRAVAELALRHGSPDLVLIGLDPRLFQGTRQHKDRQARFATLPGAAATWEITLHAHLGAWLRTYGARERLAALLRGDGTLAPRTSPLGGAATDFQKDAPETSLVTRPVADAWIEAMLARVLEDGRYTMTTERVAAVGDIIDACRARGVDVILFEVPLSRAWSWYLPMGTLAAFDALATQLAAAHEVPYVTLAALGLRFGDEDFHEPSHLNRRGARRLTEALARTAIAPRLRARAKRR